MKRVLAAAILGVVAVAGVQAHPAHEMVASYLKIQAALAADTLEGVQPAAKALTGEAAKMGAAGEAVVKAATALTAAADVDIKEARAAFGPLSDAVIAVVKADSGTHDVKLAFCPMADASWLQKEEKIRNPYYGSSMLTCGEFQPLKK